MGTKLNRFRLFFYLVFVVTDHDIPQRDVLRVSSFPLCLQETDNAQVQHDSRRNLQLDHSCLPKTQIHSPAPAKYDQESEEESNIYHTKSLSRKDCSKTRGPWGRVCEPRSQDSLSSFLPKWTEIQHRSKILIQFKFYFNFLTFFSHWRNRVILFHP